MANKRGKEYAESFRAMALERLKSCRNVTDLATELGVHRRLLYKWRDEFSPDGRSTQQQVRAAELEQENARLKRLLAEKTLEVDFFKGALQQVEARRQPGSGPGRKASTPTSKA